MRINLQLIPPPFVHGLLQVLVLVLVCLPVAAAENEVKVGATTAVRYNDNIANVETGKTDSFAFELGPYFRLDSSGAKYEIGGSYSPRFATYTDDDRDDNFTHNFGIHGDYRPAEQWKVAFSDVLGLESDADRDFNDDDSDDSGNGGEKQTLRNFLNGSVTYSASQRVQLSASGTYNIAEREDKDLSDSTQVSGRLQGNYSLSARNTFGGGALAKLQLVKASNELDVGDTTSNYYGFFLYAEHRFTPLLSLSASGGPTWLISNRDDDGQKRETSLDSFANVELVADIDRGSASLAYQRTSTDFARTSTAFIIDEVSASIDWAATTLLVLGVNGEWNQRKAILEITQGNFVNKVTQWRAAASASYRISPQVSTKITFDFLRQESKDAAPELDSTDRYRVVVRFDYHAKAFRF